MALAPDMTVLQLVQLYAPAAGFMAVSFMLGALHNRVKTLERERGEDKAAAAEKSKTDGNDHDTLILVAADVASIKANQAAITRGFEQMRAQFANLQRKRGDTGGQTFEQGGVND